MVATSTRQLSIVLFVILGAQLSYGQTSLSQSLEGRWEFQSLTATPVAETQNWLPAQVPGAVQTDLLSNKLIPDPFYGDNESRLQWIGLADWEYRTTFQASPELLKHEQIELLFEGLDTFAEVLVNDRSVLRADNMFRRWRIPVKQIMRPGANTLRVIFRSPVTSMLPVVEKLPYVLPAISTLNGGNERGLATAPYTRKAAYQYGWDWGPRFITMGIWKPVRIEAWSGLRIYDFHIRQQKITAEQASVQAELEIEALGPMTATISVEYANPSGSRQKAATQQVELEKGINTASVPLHIRSPKLWFPNGYGTQDRYTFFVAVQSGNMSTNAEVKTGLRSVELRRQPDQWGKSFGFVINGIPVFAKGANVIPFDSFPNRVTPERYRNILQSARDANMNMLRAWGGAFYEFDTFYDIADELGIMIWQDFMFGGDMVPGDLAFQENVRQEAIEQVKRLRNHSSIVLWCGNNEVETGWKYWGDRQGFKLSISPEARERVWQDYVVLFRDILKSVVAEHGGVPYWASSPSSDFEAVPPGQENGDAHYWMVWHALEPIEQYTKQFPRFMSEFGFQSFPEMRTIRSFAEAHELDIRSRTMQAHQKNKGGNERILTYMLREYPEPKDFESFVYLSQVQQAEAIRIGAEHLRRQRPRIMGSLYWQLNDCWPVASWSSIDYFGRWKALQYQAKRFYADLLVSPFVNEGKLEVYVASDKTTPVQGEIRMRFMNFEGKVLLEKRQSINIPALSSASYMSYEEKEFALKARPTESFVLFELKSGEQVVSRNVVFFDRMRNLNLPAAPKVQAELSPSADGYNLTLKSPQLARHVFISFDDVDAALSNNYLDVIPGEAITVRVTSGATIDELRRKLRVRHLMQSFHQDTVKN